MNKKTNYTWPIIGLTAVIYALIGGLKYLPGYQGFRSQDLTWMPMLNAIMNSFTFLFLLMALVAIRRKQVDRHRRFIYAAFGTTSLFLITYVAYHYMAPSTSYGGTGPLRLIYLFVLLTHILLAAVIVPLALFTVVYGLKMEVPSHRRIARWTMPLWLYVSLSGVVVYLLIRPYY